MRKALKMDRRRCITGLGALVAMTPYPASLGASERYVVPPEEARHQSTFMQWPVSRRVYSDPVFLDLVQATIAKIANTISEFEPVILLAEKQQHAAIRRQVSEKVSLWDIPTEDLWCRDSGPIFAAHATKGLAVTHIQFNGWGKKQTHREDGKIAQRVAARLDLPLLETGLRGEGGGIEQDRHGTLMAHESSWVTRSRNPGLSRQEIGDRLLNAYGANRMIWSKGLKNRDITDYHIDSLARFTGPGRILMNLPDDPDPDDPFHMAALTTYSDLRGSSMSIEVIPEPLRRRVQANDFVASYVNYYVCNGAVIGAEFGDPDTDEMARDALGRHYPGRDIISLNVDPLGELGGGVHCATQQMPAA